MDGRKQPPTISGALPDKVPPQEGSKSVGDDETDKGASSDDAVDKNNCILFGRGKGCNNNPANTRMRRLINRYRDDYQTAGRGEKKLVVLKVHRELVDAGMKFLKQQKGADGWIEAEPGEAIAKIGHAIRFSKRSKCNIAEDTDTKPCKSEADIDTKPQAAQIPAAVDPEAPVPGQVLSDNLSPGVAQEDVAASLALGRFLTASCSGFMSNDALLGHRPIMGLTLPMGSSVPTGQVGAVQEDVAASLALDRVLATSGSRFLSNDALGHHQSILGLSLPTVGSNPLHSMERLSPMDLTRGLHPPLPASMQLAAQPPPSMTLTGGLSAVDIYDLMQREHRMRQAMLYEHILRNNP